MDTKFYQASEIGKYVNSRLYDNIPVLGKSCYLGSQVTKTVHSENSYVFFERLGAGEYGEVFKAHLRQNQLRQYAIKKVALSSPLAKRYSENELKVLRLLKQLNHPNIIEFHDWFDKGEHRFLIFQLGDISFELYLNRNLEKLNSKNINEILFQLVSIVEALVKLEIQADDFNRKNMVFSYTDKMIKLIDFEKYLTPTQTGYISPVVPLPLIGLEVSHMQIEINKPSINNLGKEKANFSRASRLALRAIYTNGDISVSSQKLISDTGNWSRDLPEASRKLIASLFDSDIEFESCILYPSYERFISRQI